MAVGGDVVAQEDYRLLLGYPDEKISEKYRIDFSTSKIGGLPVRICYYINSFWDWFLNVGIQKQNTGLGEEVKS